MFEIKKYKDEMGMAIEHFRDELKKLRTGRAHPDLLANLKVEVYGQMTPLAHCANINADATTLLVTPFDPSTLANISAAIRNDSSLGLNPADDGRVIRVPVPPLTEERRKEIVKMAGQKAEEAKIVIRNIREDARKAIKAGELPEDTVRRSEKEVDDLTKDKGLEIDKLFNEKQAEIMKI